MTPTERGADTATDAPEDRAARIDRSRARAWALQIHYRWENGPVEGSMRDALVETRGSRRIAPTRVPYIRRLLKTLDEHIEEIDASLERCLENWTLDRLASIDRGILRLAATEILYFDDVPPRVSIHEALQLAVAYGGHESPRFVNGVLDALFRNERGGD